MADVIVLNVPMQGHNVVTVNGKYVQDYLLKFPQNDLSLADVRKACDAWYYKIGLVNDGATYSDAVNFNQFQQLKGWVETRVAMLEGRVKALEDKIGK